MAPREPPGPAWRPRGRPLPARIRGRELQRRRARLFAKFPCCVTCAARGQVALATIRDHTIPLAEGGRDDESNEQALCADCSETKTRAESARGVARAFHARRAGRGAGQC